MNNLRTAAARLPRASAHMPMSRLGGVRSVGGTSNPKPGTPPNKGTNVPIAVAAVVAVAGAAYFVTRSSQQHGENIVRDAEKNPQASGSTQAGEPGKPGGSPGGAPTAYKPDGQRADGSGRGLAGEITQQDMSSSIKQSLQSDAPKTAYKAEEKGNSPAKEKGAA